MSTTAQGENQHVFLRLLDQMGDEVKGLGLSAFSREGGLVAPGTTSMKEKVVIGEVVTGGPGNVSRGTLNPRTVGPGDLVIVNLYHRTHELLIQGEQVHAFNWENIMGQLQVDVDSKTLALLPLQGFIVCRVNELRAQRILMGESKIIAPGGDSMLSGGSAYDERGKLKQQLKVAVEDVVQQGPGAVVDGLWQEPNCRPGDAIMYDTSVSPVRFTVGGQGFTLVHMRHVLMTFRDGAAEETETKAKAYAEATSN